MEAGLSQDVIAKVQACNNPYVKVGVFDLDGILRSKLLHREKFLQALESGFGFCNVVLGWDSNDQLYNNTELSGWHTGFADAKVQLCPETCRRYPFQDTHLLLGQFSDESAQICPRNLLQRVTKRLEAKGYFASAAFEYEFFLFNETHASLQEKQFQNLQPLTPGQFGYSDIRTGTYAEFHQTLLDTCLTMGITIEGLHTETGPGVMEAAIQYSDAMKAADNAGLFKTITKIVAQRHDLFATFMARWSQSLPGQSGHIHISLQDAHGQGVFFDADAEHQCAKVMRHFIAGQQKYMPECLVLSAPTLNSYTRLVPGFWAPTAATLGVDNRTCALRIIPGNAQSQRIEYRVAGADANPYLALSAALASGLAGIEEQLEPMSMSTGNAYEQVLEPRLQNPSNLYAAVERFSQSEFANRYLGESFVQHYSATRQHELAEAQAAITDWQLKRYFEII